MIWKNIKKLDPAKLEEIMTPLRQRYQDVEDPWGLNLETIEKVITHLYPIYKSYFRVRVFGEVDAKPSMFVGNHSGQIAIDAVLVGLALSLDVKPPRIVRGMIERFLAAFPFLAPLIAESGSVLGDRRNCEYLLQRGESVLVFPEGVEGVAKESSDFYQLQHFTHGFVRMALKTKTPLVPFAVIGAEEFYPLVIHLKKLAQFLGLPALPVTPTFPLLGPLGLIPLPSPVDIYFDQPYLLPDHLNSSSSDEEIAPHVMEIKTRVQKLIEEGLRKRRSFFDKWKFLDEKLGIKDKRQL